MLEKYKPNAVVRKPKRLRRQLPKGPLYENIRTIIKTNRLHTVCQESKCPNSWECFSKKTATFLIMGTHCTRNCSFCAVPHGPLNQPDPDEPKRVATAAKEMGLRYVVITSVTRDDLPDGGAKYFGETVKEIRKTIPDAIVEILIPDFNGSMDALKRVILSRPNIINHNIETCHRLYPYVRQGASYKRSLNLLKNVGFYDTKIPAKSGLMLGLGESSEEIVKTLEDLFKAGVRILTLGQYLQPSRQHVNVARYIPPEEFDVWRDKALRIGFIEVSSGPLVRSSYNAEECYLAAEGSLKNKFTFLSKP